MMALMADYNQHAHKRISSLGRGSPTGMTSRPMPSAGIRPILSAERAAVAIVRAGMRNAMFYWVVLVCFEKEVTA
jgi:hypothetical protein